MHYASCLLGALINYVGRYLMRERRRENERKEGRGRERERERKEEQR